MEYKTKRFSVQRIYANRKPRKKYQDKIFSAAISTELHNALEVKANELNTSISSLIRILIREAVSGNNQELSRRIQEHFNENNGKAE